MKLSEELAGKEKIYIAIIIFLIFSLIRKQRNVSYFIIGSGNGENNKITLKVPRENKRLRKRHCNKNK